MAEERRHTPRHRGPGVPPEKAKDFGKTVKSLLNYMGRFKIALFVVLIFSVASTLFNVIGPKILGNATTELFEGVVSKLSGQCSIDFTKIGKILAILVVIYIISSVFGWIQGIVMAYVSQKMTYRH